MSTSRKTIFELEKRCDLLSEYQSVLNDIVHTPIRSHFVNETTLFPLLNTSIRVWPYRRAATSIDNYTNRFGFNVFTPHTPEGIIYSFEILLNLLHWAPMYEVNLASDYGSDYISSSTVTPECERCIENIECILESINMRVRSIDRAPFSQYIISKRDADVDAVIETVPELSEALLSYLDVRNRNDENAKKGVLKAIADYLEDRHRSKYYKGTEYSSLEDNIFTVFNKVDIRHGDKKQWKLPKAERMKLYDQTFKAAIHLLQMENVKEFNQTVNEMKKAQTDAVNKPE